MLYRYKRPHSTPTWFLQQGKQASSSYSIFSPSQRGNTQELLRLSQSKQQHQQCLPTTQEEHRRASNSPSSSPATVIAAAGTFHFIELKVQPKDLINDSDDLWRKRIRLLSTNRESNDPRIRVSLRKTKAFIPQQQGEQEYTLPRITSISPYSGSTTAAIATTTSLSERISKQFPSKSNRCNASSKMQ